MARSAPLAPMHEDQLEPLQVQPRLLGVLEQRFAQFRSMGRFAKPRKGPDHLRFRVVQARELVDVESLQRSNSHGPDSWAVVNYEDYASAVPCRSWSHRVAS